MSIEERLMELSRVSGYTVATVTAHYDNRVRVIREAYGSNYKGRESHIKVLAYRGAERFYIDDLPKFAAEKPK